MSSEFHRIDVLLLLLQGPEKRKWAQISPRRVVTPGVGSGTSERTRAKTRPQSAVFSSATFDGWEDGRSSSSAALDCGNSASSDDEVQALIAGSAQDSPLPLEFRTSPPEGAHRPTRSLSPPPKLFLADPPATSHLTSWSTCEPQVALAVANGNAGSPRKRHRHGQRAHHIQRPCLDFEKMQQVSLPFVCFGLASGGFRVERFRIRTPTLPDTDRAGCLKVGSDQAAAVCRPTISPCTSLTCRPECGRNERQHFMRPIVSTW